MAIQITHETHGGLPYVTVKYPSLEEYNVPISTYVSGWDAPNYPVPAMIGEVIVFNDKYAFDIIVTDCDEAFDPRLCIAILKYRDDEVITDYPHDSPNYR